jgi:hypothetical protein
MEVELINSAPCASTSERAFLALGRALLRGGLLRRNVRALFGNGDGFLGAGGFCVLGGHFHVISFCGNHRGHDMDHSDLLEKQGNSAAAKATGIAPNTLLKWMKEPKFEAGLREARRGAYGQSIARLQQGTAASNKIGRSARGRNGSPPL